MLILQETTVWKTGTPNHTYLSDDSKSIIYAYMKRGESKLTKFKVPLSFDVKGRTFVITKVKKEVSDFREKPNSTIEVKGNKGATYYVSNDRGVWNCTCMGFKFRNKCKHIDKEKSV